MSSKTDTWPLLGSNIVYSTPRNVNTHYVDNTARSHSIFQSGSKLEQQIEGSLELQAKYLAVSGKLAVKASLERTVKQEGMYALISSTYERYRAELDFGESHADLINPRLIVELQALHPSFDNSDIASKQKFYSFAEKWGTHLITGLIYGQRYTLKSETMSTDSDVISNFSANINLHTKAC